MADKQLDLFDFDFTPKRLEILTPDEIFDQADQAMLSSLGEDNRIERKPR